MHIRIQLQQRQQNNVVGRRKEGGTTYNPTSMAQGSYKTETGNPVHGVRIHKGKALTHVHGVTQRARTP
jgi:hypothetical protein